MIRTQFHRLTPWVILAVSLPSAIPAPAADSPAPHTPVTITVSPTPRQVFRGFGVSLGNWGRDYQKLSPAERSTLSRLLWHDLRFNTLRLWMNTNEYAPTRGSHDMTTFLGCYVDSGIIADARKEGVTTLLLAPDGMPDYMKAPRPGGSSLKDEEIGNYAALLADFIQQLRASKGILLNATGIQNEPNDLDRIAPEQMASVVKALRTALDRRGLNAVKIIGPENANVDSVLYDTLDRLKADPEAWNALSGIASHSYGMAATEDAARRIANPAGENTKEYWMTEASANGPEAPGDAQQAASLAGRFLNDMNHRVTQWVHFLGFEIPDTHDNATRIMAFTPNPLHVTLFQKYYYYQQLSSAFDSGATFRQSQSSTEGEMTWTYGKKPALIAACAKNPDGSWGVALSNFTFPDGTTTANGKELNFGSSFNPAQTFDVTLNLPELANVKALGFYVHRSNSNVNNIPAGTLLMHNGQVTIPEVGPLELVTLRSGRGEGSK